jgi:serine/threonine protein phosphatase PrpC
LDPATLEQTVTKTPDPNQACADLTAEANKAGGPDNISVIIIKPENLPSWQALVSALTTVRTA